MPRYPVLPPFLEPVAPFPIPIKPEPKVDSMDIDDETNNYKEDKAIDD